jgi:hypothetical protein
MQNNQQNKNEIEKNAWKEVYQGGGAHLQRVKKEYEDSGVEIKTLPLLSTESEGCTVCYEDGEQLYKLYIRKISESK